MSAKRRAETIAKFCVPVKDAPVVDEESMGVGSRLRHQAQSQPQRMEIIEECDNASDFVPEDDHCSDTEFDSDEEPSAKRRKGKGKARVKRKASTKSKVLEVLEELDYESNPRVMLISLKGEPLACRDLVTLNEFS